MSCNYVYLTSFLDARWERRTGIPRVEYEIANEFVQRGAKLMAFSKFQQRFVIVGFEAVQKIVRIQDQNLDEIIDAGSDLKHGSVSLLASRTVARMAALIGGTAGAKLFALVSANLPPKDRRTAAGKLKLFDNANLAIHYLDALSWTWSGLLRTSNVPQAVNFQPGDSITIPGIIWDREPQSELDRLRRDAGVRVVAYVHDIIPIRRPEFYTDSTGVERFRRYIEALIRCCDCFCVNSDFVGKELSSFIREGGHRDIPVFKVPLCANISPQTPPQITPRLKSLGLADGHYALYVSTFSPRKNHMGAYLLWRRLAAKLGTRLPPLVLAGQRGWHAGDTFRQLENDPLMWGKFIHFVESPTDGELSELYRNCAFTIFPSHYEGWGLPVTESLEFGKPCIAADNTSLREAGQGLALNIDNLDGVAWLETIVKFVEDETQLRETSERIALLYDRRTWHQVGDEMFKIVKATEQTRIGDPGKPPASKVSLAQ